MRWPTPESSWRSRVPPLLLSERGRKEKRSNKRLNTLGDARLGRASSRWTPATDARKAPMVLGSSSQAVDHVLDGLESLFGHHLHVLDTLECSADDEATVDEQRP